MTLAYEELVDFIAGGASSRDVAEFTPSDSAKALVADLIHRQKTIGLSSEETADLQNYLQLEHLLRLAKARARLRLSDE